MTRPQALADDNIVAMPFDGSIAVDVYSLMYLDTDDVKPASSLAYDTDGADAAAKKLNTQKDFAAAFAGVALEGRLAAQDDGAGDMPVAKEFPGVFDCVSSTFEAGDLVAVAVNSGATALEKTKLEKTTTQAAAIGYVTRREASATTRVHVKLFSRVLPSFVAAS